MTGLEVALALKRADVVTGESVVAAATIVNKGAAVAEVNGAGALSPLEYTLRSDDGAVVHRLSQRGTIAEARAGRPGPPLDDEPAVLAPGESLSFEEDLARYAWARIAPGRYRVSASLATPEGPILSSEVELMVSQPAVERLATLYCPYRGAVATAFDHTGPDGAVTLLQQETDGQRVDAGVFVRRKNLDGPPDDVAVAIHAAPRLDARWVAWLRGGVLGALSAVPVSILQEAPAAPLDLAGATLVPPGFQASDDAALFLAVGARDGAAQVVPCLATGGGISVGPSFPLGGAPPTKILACRVLAPDDEILLVWAEPEGSGARILARSLRPDGVPRAGAARVLHRGARPLAALAIAPLPAGPKVHVHALFGPEGRGARMTYLRFPIDPTAPREEHILRAPDAPVMAWAISGLEAGELLVLAHAGGCILQASARAGSRWRTLAEDAGDVRWLHVAASPRGYWAARWVDPRVGLRFVSDPDFVR